MGKLKYTKEILEEAVKKADSISDVVRFFGKEKSGSVHNHISKKLKKFEIDTSHFTRSKNQTTASQYSKLSSIDILVNDRLNGRREKTKFLRRALIEVGHKYECAGCSNGGEWLGEKLVLEVDHINEDRLDNRIENLRFLCPNCHSLRGNNIPTRNTKICKKCGKGFTNSNKVFCSVKCHNERGSSPKIKTIKIYKSNKPSSEQLVLDMKFFKSFVGIGRKYEVSDSAVRKWFKKDNLSLNKKDY